MTEDRQKQDFDSSLLSDYEEINISVHRPMSRNSYGGDSGIGDSTVFDISNDDGCVTSPHKSKYSSLSLSPRYRNNNNNNIVSPGGIYSPPYKRVRALRLFDTPSSPNTMVEKGAAFHSPQLPRSRLFVNNDKNATLRPQTALDKPAANQNPFTPNGLLLASKKRTRSKRNLATSPLRQIPFPKLSDSLDDSSYNESDSEDEHPTKKVALHDSNISRYHQEFHELSLIGTGEFGSVYKCINRLDGCIYAVKRSIKPVAGSKYEKLSMYEVYAHAVLGKHPHVLRYYSAWAEEDHMIIQNEFCNGGSLAGVIAASTADSKPMNQQQLRHLILNVADGLRYMHSMMLVHMDIKPGNIFISTEKRVESSSSESADDCYDDDDGGEEIVTYKIGDLGHVTSLSDPRVEEGDCRYLPNEILHEDYSNLTKADIFALGVTVYEAAGGGPVPKNGPEWHAIRNGKLKNLPHLNREFNALMKQMVDPDPNIRPSALGLITHRALCPPGNKSKAQLRRELNAEKLKTEILQKKLEEAANVLKHLPKSVLTSINVATNGRPNTRASRLVGNKVNRSHSTTNF